MGPAETSCDHLVHRRVRGVCTPRAHLHYLGLVQTSQGLQEVAEIAADAVEVLEWSNLYYIYKLGNRGFGIFVYSSLNKPNK